MKKTMYLFTISILVLSLGLFGCAKDEEEPNDSDDPIGVEDDNEENKEEDNVGDESETSEEIANELNEIVANNEEPKELVSFIDGNINKVTSIEADQMLTELINKLEESKEEYGDKLIELDDGELINLSNEEYFPEDKIKDIKDEELRELVEELMENKYKLQSSEGMLYPIVDYEKLKEYDEHVSDEVKDYIDLKAIDSNTPIAADAALVVSHDELADIIIETEEYIEKYAGGVYHEEVERMYESKLNIYLTGLPNTPIHDYDTKEINKDVLDSYVNTGSSGDSVTAFVVGKYVNLIGENEKIIDDGVLSEANELVEEALTLLVSAK